MDLLLKPLRNKRFLIVLFLFPFSHCFLGKWIGLLDKQNRCHFTKETVNNNFKEGMISPNKMC